MILYFIFLDSVIAAKKKKVMTTEDFLRPKEDIFDALTTFHTLYQNVYICKPYFVKKTNSNQVISLLLISSKMI